MYKLIINNNEKPTLVKFTDDQPDLNINPDTKFELELPKDAKITIEENQIILEGVKRPI